MADSNDSFSIKLVATCQRCGEPIRSSDSAEVSADRSTSGSTGSSISNDGRSMAFCASCRAARKVDAEDDADDAADDAADFAAGVRTNRAADPAADPVADPAADPVADPVKPDSSTRREPISDEDVPAHYEILDAIPGCQHGKAYLVHDKNLDARFVLRFVTIGVARLTGGLPIETVANLLVQQNHPHLTTVYDWMTHTSKNYMVLDPPAPRNLETIIKTEGFLDLPRAIDIFIQVCEALEELHKSGIVHGHLRPSSIGVVTQSNVDSVKVTNFSIANMTSNNIDQPLKISRNYTCNDVFYMSPEELRGEFPSIPADIYSLGCVMFHSITGKPVYRARTVQEVKDLHLDVTPAKFRRRYEIPPNVELVVLRMLDPVPANRYKTAKAIRRDLERLRDNKPPILEDKWKSFMTFFGQ
jgi:serine/threonine protein kinase